MVAGGEEARWSSRKRSAPALVMCSHGAVAKQSVRRGPAAHRAPYRGEPTPSWFAVKMLVLTILVAVITYIMLLYITQALSLLAPEGICQEISCRNHESKGPSKSVVM